MKTRIVAFAFTMICMFAITPAFNDVQAQQRQQQTSVGTLLTGLLNVNVQNVAIAIETGDITLVNVEDVLNDANIQFLNNSINNNSILSDIQVTITNLLQNADIITDNQVVVGVLSGGQLVIQDL